MASGTKAGVALTRAHGRRLTVESEAGFDPARWSPAGLGDPRCPVGPGVPLGGSAGRRRHLPRALHRIADHTDRKVRDVVRGMRSAPTWQPADPSSPRPAHPMNGSLAPPDEELGVTSFRVRPVIGPRWFRTAATRGLRAPAPVLAQQPVGRRPLIGTALVPACRYGRPCR